MYQQAPDKDVSSFETKIIVGEKVVLKQYYKDIIIIMHAGTIKAY